MGGRGCAHYVAPWCQACWWPTLYSWAKARLVDSAEPFEGVCLGPADLKGCALFWISLALKNVRSEASWSTKERPLGKVWTIQFCGKDADNSILYLYSILNLRSAQWSDKICWLLRSVESRLCPTHWWYLLNFWYSLLLCRFEAWRYAPDINQRANIRRMFPGLGLGVAAFLVLVAVEELYWKPTHPSSDDHHH